MGHSKIHCTCSQLCSDLVDPWHCWSMYLCSPTIQIQQSNTRQRQTQIPSYVIGSDGYRFGNTTQLGPFCLSDELCRSAAWNTALTFGAVIFNKRRSPPSEEEVKNESINSRLKLWDLGNVNYNPMQLFIKTLCLQGETFPIPFKKTSFSAMLKALTIQNRLLSFNNGLCLCTCARVCVCVHRKAERENDGEMNRKGLLCLWGGKIIVFIHGCTPSRWFSLHMHYTASTHLSKWW